MGGGSELSVAVVIRSADGSGGSSARAQAKTSQLERRERLDRLRVPVAPTRGRIGAQSSQLGDRLPARARKAKTSRPAPPCISRRAYAARRAKRSRLGSHRASTTRAGTPPVTHPRARAKVCTTSCCLTPASSIERPLGWLGRTAPAGCRQPAAPHWPQRLPRSSVRQARRLPTQATGRAPRVRRSDRGLQCRSSSKPAGPRRRWRQRRSAECGGRAFRRTTSRTCRRCTRTAAPDARAAITSAYVYRDTAVNGGRNPARPPTCTPTLAPLS